MICIYTEAYRNPLSLEVLKDLRLRFVVANYDEGERQRWDMWWEWERGRELKAWESDWVRWGFVFCLKEWSWPKRRCSYIGKKKGPKRCSLRLEKLVSCESLELVTVHRTEQSNCGPFGSLIFFAWNSSSC